MISKKEYDTILKLLEEGKSSEIKEYLTEQLNIEYINSARKTIMELINSDCDKKYPSYYERTKLHKGVLKLYRGIYTEIGNGFVICHKDSNLFQLYDRSILTPEINNMLSANVFQDNEQKTQRIIECFSKLDKDNLKLISLKKKEKENLIILTKDGYKITIPNEYYVVAHRLLGDDVNEYIFDGGIYIDSSKGKAIVMRRNK